MLTQKLTVISHDAKRHQVLVSTQQQQGCSQCGEQGCGIALMAKVLAKKPFTLSIPENLSVSAGQTLSLSLPENMLVKIALCFYLLPLLGLLLGALAASWFLAHLSWNTDLVVADFVAIGGAVVGFLLAWYLARRISAYLLYYSHHQIEVSSKKII